MPFPQSLFLSDQLESRVEEGWLRKQTQGSLSIYNYTEATQYGRHWDEYTRACRGLVLDSEYNLVALPFPKFFNVGEPDCPELPDSSYEIYEKLDGSLGVWFHYEGRWRVATRGSFDNDYTRWADFYAPLLSVFPKTWTVMTEICMPSDLDGLPRAVQHKPGIYLLGARDVLHHHDVSPQEVFRAEWPEGFRARHNGADSIETLLEDAKLREGTEGWVVRFQNGLRVKIKTAWYLRLFRAISCLNDSHIKELMLTADVDKWLREFPEELQPEARAIYDGIQGRFVARWEGIMQDFNRYRALLPSDWRGDRAGRKEFAVAVKDHPDRTFLFSLLDGQDITARLLLEC